MVIIKKHKDLYSSFSDEAMKQINTFKNVKLEKIMLVIGLN